jgi:hypothetical protein
MFGLLAAALATGGTLTTLATSRAKDITIKSSSLHGSTVLVLGNVEAKSVQLECVLSAPDCVVPVPGTYLIEKTPGGDSRYQDCANVDILKKNTRPNDEQKVGRYCLLDGEN